MKKTILLFCTILSYSLSGQVFTTNTTPVGWEHNILFNADTRYTVTQNGPNFNPTTLFDGRMEPSYTSTGITSINPTEILIEGLPSIHTQAGAWIGWTTRYWPARRFKIEGYDQYNSANTWRVIADYSTTDYNNFNFAVRIPVGGAYTKLKFTFLEGTGTGGAVGASELFFIHPEATTPYAGLLSSATNNWQKKGTNLVYNNGNVGIGTSTTGPHILAVNGSIGAREIKVETTTWPDYVFKKEYELPTLLEVENHIKKNGHLKGIPNEKDILKNGISLGEMNVKLLQKIEELTLYMIEQKKEIEILKRKNNSLDDLTKKVHELEDDMQKLNKLE